MTLTMTPLPANVSAKSLLPNTDPATRIVTATGRPTRHAWTMGQTILAAMGARLDLYGSGRRHGEDLELLQAWLHAYDVRTLVIRHATNIHNLDLLDDLLHVTTAAGADLALTCDETVGQPLAAWVDERSGRIDPDFAPLRRRLARAARTTNASPVDDNPVGDNAADDFPMFLPRVDFYAFRARCRDTLTPTQHQRVDDIYRAVFKSVAADPYATHEEATRRLTELFADASHVGKALVSVRAAQAAMFTNGILLKVNLDYFLNAINDGENRRLTQAEVRSLRAYRTPWRAVATLLRDADVTRDQITALTLANVTENGDLTGITHAPMHPDARAYLRALRTFRLIQGAHPTSPLINESNRYIGQAQRRASADLNHPQRQEPRTLRRHTLHPLDKQPRHRAPPPPNPAPACPRRHQERNHPMTSNRVRYANSDKFRARLFDLGISERELARRSGTSGATVRAILHRDEISASIQLADVYRMLDQLGLTPGQLLDPPTPDEPDDTPTDDTQTLAAILTSEKTMHPAERLAVSLGWTLDRLHETITHLDADLRPIGLRIHRSSMGVTIRPADDRADNALQRLAQLHDHEDGIHQGTARVLYAVYAGTMSTRETGNDQQVQLGALKNRGAVTFGTGSGNRFTLTDDATYAFNID